MWWRRDGVDVAWGRLERFLARRLSAHRAALRPGADSASLSALRAGIGRDLPEPFLASLRRHDGEGGDPPPGLIYGMPLLSAAGVLRHWRASAGALAAMTPAENANRDAPDPTGRVRDLRISAGWVPFAEDGADACLGLDLDPGPAGRAGQVINFGGREFRKRVLAPDFGAFLAWLAAAFEAGNWRLEEVDGDPVLSLRDPPVDHLLDALPALFPDPLPTARGT